MRPISCNACSTTQCFVQQYCSADWVNKIDDPRMFGVVKVNDKDVITDFIEKPQTFVSNLAIIGRYILTPEIFEILEKTPPDRGGEIQLTNGLRLLLEKQSIYAYQFEGKRYDAGDKLGFLKATVEFALKREDLGKDFSNYLKSLNL